MQDQPPRTVVPARWRRLLGAAPLALALCSAGSQAQSPAAPFADSAKQADVWIENYKFRSGETSKRIKLHYATMGTPRRDTSGRIENAVLVLHWTGNDGTVVRDARYVESLYGPGKPLDAQKYYLIFPDNLGHGQSSKPSDGLKMAFPHYNYQDLVDLQHHLVTKTLGVQRLHAILGMSMGGMNAWQWAERYPEAVKGIMPVVALPVPISGRNMLWRRIVIGQITADPDWHNGNYTAQPRSYLYGYATLAMLIEGVPHLQDIVPDAAVADKLIDKLKRGAAGKDANDLIYSLKSSMTDYDPRPGLAAITAKVYALNFDDDEFNPARLGLFETSVAKVPQARFVVQAGSARSYGHLTMAHPELWSEHVAKFMHQLAD
jgi:homoserine O-acetyltransferase/O-succinyltransferase